MWKYLKEHFIKSIHSERGSWVAVAIGGSALVGAGASIYNSQNAPDSTSTSSGGTTNQYTPEQQEWMKTYYPQLGQISQNLVPLLQQQLQQPGLPPELENQVWQLAKQRLGQGYDKLGTQLGQVGASRGLLQSGPTVGNWLNQVGLGKLQGEQQLGTERALANYQSLQQAIQNAQSYMGLQSPSPIGSTYTSTSTGQQTQQPTDWGSLGTLFAKGLSMFQPGATPGSTIVGGVGGTNTGYYGSAPTWSPY